MQKDKSGSKPKQRWLRLKSRSLFENLLAEARAVSRRLNAIIPRTAVALSAQGFLRASIEVAGTTPQRVDALDRLLSNGGKRIEHSQASIRRMLRDLQNGNLRNPPTDVSVIERFVASHSSEAVPGELAAVGYTSAELFCVMILAAGRKFGATHFGTADNAEEHDAEVSALTRRLEELMNQISTSWSATDINDGKYDPKTGRTSAPTFKGTGVPVTPAADAGRRLVEFLEAQRAQRAARA
jgi:hypothetical protein